MITKLNKILFEDIIIAVGTVVLIFSWFALILTEVSLFHLPLIVIFSVISVILLFLLLRQKLIDSTIIFHKIDKIVLIFILVVSLFNSILSHETYFGGRDQGVYFNSAVFLANNHSLLMPELLSYEPQKNESPSYPGYKSYFGNIPQPDFHYGYISWLATFYSIGGINGVKSSNFLPLMLGLLCMYTITAKILNRKAGLMSVILFGISYIMFWFSRETLTEIYTFFLIIFGILNLMKTYEKIQIRYLIIALLSFGYILHTRVEMVFIFPIILFLLLTMHIKGRISLTNKYFVLVFIFISLNFILYSKYIQPGYNQIIISFISKYLNTSPQATSKIGGIETLPLYTNLNDLIARNAERYYFFLFYLYNLLVVGVLGFLGAIYVMFNSKKKLYSLIPFIIIFPTIYYVIDPNISFDTPWFFRRYIFALIPVFYIYLVYILSKINRKLALYIYLFILSVNIVISSPIIFHVENKNLFNQVAKISKYINQDDIIFYDIHALSSDMSILADPLYFVFNIPTEYVSEWMAWNGQLNNKWINRDLTKYKNIYFITSSNGENWYNKYIPKKKMESIASLSFQIPKLEYTKINHLSNYYESLKLHKVIYYNESIKIYKLNIKT